MKKGALCLCFLFIFICLGCANVTNITSSGLSIQEYFDLIDSVKSTVNTYFQPEVAKRCLEADIYLENPAHIWFWKVGGYCNPFVEEITFTQSDIKQDSFPARSLIVHEFIHFVWFHTDLVNKNAFEKDLEKTFDENSTISEIIESYLDSKNFLNIWLFEETESYSRLGEIFLLGSNYIPLPERLKKHYKGILNKDKGILD